MKAIPLDVETTIIQSGNPFHPDNKLCLVGIGKDIHKIEYDEEPYGYACTSIINTILANDLLVGFNIKFDYHWIRNYGILAFQEKRTWDCQAVHFIQSGQKDVMPSLNEVANYWNLGSKIDTIASKYWDNGIDTPQIPYDELREYLEQDLSLTYAIYEKQRNELSNNPIRLRLCSLVNQDLIVLEEMEWNGIKYDFEDSKEQSEKAKDRLKEIDSALSILVESSLPKDSNFIFNWNSGDHISALLFGGSISQVERTVSGVYKTGAKAGHPKYSLKENMYNFPKLVEPLPGSNLKKEGFYSTSEETLRSLKAKGDSKKIIDLLLERAYLEKLNGTYLEGLDKLYVSQKGSNGIIHGQYNQCVTVTGRLSSSKPNLQNFSGDLKKLFITRF